LSSGLRGSALAIELGCTHSIPTLWSSGFERLSPRH
jgi:hypothetical protein